MFYVKTIAAVEMNLGFELGFERLSLGGGVHLEALPAVMTDEQVLSEYGRGVRDHVRGSADYALTLDEELDSLEALDDWKGPRERKRIEALLERVRFTRVALWLQKPATVDARAVHQRATKDDLPVRYWSVVWAPIAVLPGQENGRFSRADIEAAEKMNESIQGLVRPHAPWLSVRMLEAALGVQNWDMRYLMMWIVLETLFGPEQPNETTHQLAERIAVFLEEKPDKREVVYRRAKKAYKYRSQIAHGTSVKVKEAESLQWLAKTEDLLRPAMLKMLGSTVLLNMLSEQRERYLLNRCLGMAEEGPLPAAGEGAHDSTAA